MNIMLATVTERTREIGTLRAIGLRRGGVVGLFVGEAALLVLLGCIAGLLLTTDCAITEIKEKKAKPAMPAGAGGGMEDMDF